MSDVDATAAVRLGRWQDVLADVDSCDVLYSDPPFSARTHNGYRSGDDCNRKNRITYDAICEEDACSFVERWAPAVRGWVVLHTDHVAWRWWDSYWTSAGFYAFQPVAWLKKAAGPRMTGDGPAVGVEWLFVARTRSWPKARGSRPPWYEVQVDKTPTGGRVVGIKRVQDVRRVLVDYAQPGDLVVDPFAGTATIGQACIETGRRYIGSERDPDTHRLASVRLRASMRCMPGFEPDRWRDEGGPEQLPLMDGEE